MQKKRLNSSSVNRERKSVAEYIWFSALNAVIAAVSKGHLRGVSTICPKKAKTFINETMADGKAAISKGIILTARQSTPMFTEKHTQRLSKN